MLLLGGSQSQPLRLLELADWSLVFETGVRRGVYSDTAFRVMATGDGSAIAGIRDFSAYGRHGTQSTGANQGLFQRDLYPSNSVRHGLETNGTTCSYAVASMPTGYTHIHGFAVLDWQGDDTPVTRGTFLSGNFAADGPILRIAHTTDPVPGALIWSRSIDGDSNTVLRYPAASALGKGLHIVEFRAASGSQYLRVDNNAPRTGTVVATYGTNAMQTFLSDPSGGQSWIGRSSLLYMRFGTSFLSDDVVTAVRANLGRRWGISV